MGKLTLFTLGHVVTNPGRAEPRGGRAASQRWFYQRHAKARPASAATSEATGESIRFVGLPAVTRGASWQHERLNGMPATALEDANQAMEALRRQFVERMARDLRALSSCADRFDDGSMSAADIASLRHICHSLTGSAGLFGFHDVADAAAHAHAAVKADQADGPKLGSVTRALAAQILEVLAPQVSSISDFGVTERP